VSGGGDPLVRVPTAVLLPVLVWQGLARPPRDEPVADALVRLPLRR